MNRDEEVADALERTADLLEVQNGGAFRVRAYRETAAYLRREMPDVAHVLASEGIRGLVALPTIGRSIAAQIRELVGTGRLGNLERLEGQVSPVDLFATVPGVGEEFAHRIHEALRIETLEELELATRDGRLEGVAGFGERRVRALRETLAGMLSRSSRRRARRYRILEASGRGARKRDVVRLPPVELLLELDAEYRRLAAEDSLPKIAPRRFNPKHEAWLPIWHEERNGWSFTLLFSNTARAHELGTTHDWVVIYFERDGHEDQCTVITAHSGPSAGQRIVRGREGAGA